MAKFSLNLIVFDEVKFDEVTFFQSFVDIFSVLRFRLKRSKNTKKQTDFAEANIISWIYFKS
jgi:hypothetical protein